MPLDGGMRKIARSAQNVVVSQPAHRAKQVKLFSPPKCFTHEKKMDEKFNPDVPARLKRMFTDMPAHDKWFVEESGTWDEPEPEPEAVVTETGKKVLAKRQLKAFHERKMAAERMVRRTLNLEYLKEFGDTVVPLERTSVDLFQRQSFERFDAPLSLLLEHITALGQRNKVAESTLYLAQYPLGDLPQPLRDDVPQPEILKKLGKGDVYASSLWMGAKGSKTPLHRDPNPNLLVHLCGKKIVRLVAPKVGKEMYDRVRTELGKVGGSANMRGEEMMQGEEMEALEREIWNKSKTGDKNIGIEVEMKKGDGLYIPLGWWHAVKNTAHGPNVSVNWWFR